MWWADEKGGLAARPAPGHPRAEGPDAQQSISSGAEAGGSLCPSGSSLPPPSSSARATLQSWCRRAISGGLGGRGQGVPGSPPSVPVFPVSTSVHVPWLHVALLHVVLPPVRPHFPDGEAKALGRPEPEPHLTPFCSSLLRTPLCRCQRRRAQLRTERLGSNVTSRSTRVTVFHGLRF